VLIDIMKNGDKLDRVETKLFIYPLRKFGIGAPIGYALKGANGIFAGPGWLMNFDEKIEMYYTF